MPFFFNSLLIFTYLSYLCSYLFALLFYIIIKVFHMTISANELKFEAFHSDLSNGLFKFSIFCIFDLLPFFSLLQIHFFASPISQ